MGIAKLVCLLALAAPARADQAGWGAVAAAKRFSISLKYLSGRSAGRVYQLDCANGSLADVGQAARSPELKLSKAPYADTCALILKFVVSHARELDAEASTRRPRPSTPHVPWAVLEVAGVKIELDPSPQTLCRDAALKDCVIPRLTRGEALASLLKLVITRRLGKLDEPDLG